MSFMKELTKGIVKENPTFVIVLGMCPTLATTTSVNNAIGMGLAATFVLVCSNIMISLIRKITPDKIRIPVYVIVIAAFVSIVDMVMAAYLPDLHKALGLFIPLIVVNCIIMGRAEAFASKNSVMDSMADGIGMGLGFTLALTLMSTFREILGSGTWAGMKVMPAIYDPMLIAILTPGAFITLGLLMAAINMLKEKFL
ncbi:MAG TPA: electron transport complex subunit E [Candidatus Syntrophosphaera thermopropionivorans]|jgi:electron transport complex protein RnfE|nr:electron transport complex subunit E [Candidatus Syntrophosphaera sp.]HOH82758.1 electron transport complex subunit E [Candidatus Syntrophosphaera thermopropionivorans]HQB50526.1 electron transport complex subunit E [Candidatus Cloacimonas sp.]HOZ92264.1 electron transport complex subunit E [Candidatus Syntrophosphaera thermopropionivorans]HQM79831.1 electron transport complex subunit E [Candidatus Syntrophosphaera sp.]